LSFSSTQDEYALYPKVQQNSNLQAAKPQLPPTSVSYVIQSGKMPFVQQHNYEPSQGAMKIKEEPESPTTRNLPATPKSNDPPSNQQSEASDVNEQQEEENDESGEGKKFILAPTPAQLGKAPLQRRLNRGKFDKF
jgi:capicua transcriptional repressor